MDLFQHQTEKEIASHAPLADRMRPKTFEEYAGQHHIIGEGKLLRDAIGRDEIPSMILWGPPGSGKTTLAHVLAESTKSRFIAFSALQGGVKEIREIVQAAEDARKFYKERTVVFVDEIHRFNKSQQDAFLPHVERGTITLIGATTENPSFEINSALLSRCRVFVLEALSPEDVEAILRRALSDKKRGLGNLPIEITDNAIKTLAVLANGDARTALNALELGVKSGKLIDEALVKESLQRSHLLYDRAGEEHYNIISALHKSMRGNDANAALYWLGRMLESGEDPLYVARRLVRFASEDIGLADPLALPQAVAAYQAAHFIGMPECNVILAQCVAYLAKAPKSNALYVAYNMIRSDIHEFPTEPVPVHLRNAPTKLMKELGYGKDYKYTPDFDTPEEAAQDYLPERLQKKRFLPES